MRKYSLVTLFGLFVILFGCTTTPGAPGGTTIYLGVLVVASGTHITDMQIMGAVASKEACEKAVANAFAQAGPIPEGIHVDAHCVPFTLSYVPSKARAKTKAGPGETEL